MRPLFFRITGHACETMIVLLSRCLGADISKAKLADAGTVLSEVVREYMSTMGVVNGLKELGYTSEDIPMLVTGTLPQVGVANLWVGVALAIYNGGHLH